MNTPILNLMPYLVSPRLLFAVGGDWLRRLWSRTYVLRGGIRLCGIRISIRRPACHHGTRRQRHIARVRKKRQPGALDGEWCGGTCGSVRSQQQVPPCPHRSRPSVEAHHMSVHRDEEGRGDADTRSTVARTDGPRFLDPPGPPCILGHASPSTQRTRQCPPAAPVAAPV